MDIRKKSGTTRSSHNYRPHTTANHSSQQIEHKSSDMYIKRIFSNRKVSLVAASIVLVVFIIGGASLFRSGSDLNPEQSVPLEQASTHFNPLIPTATDSVGDSYSFDRDRNVLSFNTQYEGASLTVSQQAAPEATNLEEGGLANLARQIGAEDTVETDMGVAYITTESESSGQTVIFVSEDALVFIRSDRSLSDELWQDYINQLSAI